MMQPHIIWRLYLLINCGAWAAVVVVAWQVFRP
jgi:hypothetical protein